MAKERSTINRQFETLIPGIAHQPNGVALVRELRVGDEVDLVREYDNQYDENAVAVFNADGDKLGYIPSQVAADLARSLDEDDGSATATVVEKVKPGREYRTHNALLEINLSRRNRRFAKSKGGMSVRMRVVGMGLVVVLAVMMLISYFG